jgi:signal transduction histidine kinase
MGRAASTFRPTVAVVLAGILTTVVLASFTMRQLDGSAQERLDGRAFLVTQAVQAEIDRYEDALVLVAASAGSTRDFTQEQFDAAVDPLSRMGLAGATSVAFLAPQVSDPEVPALQRFWRARGVDLTLTPSPDLDQHLFSIMSRPLDGAAQVRTGLDVAAAPAPYAALVRSAHEGGTTITPPYTLLIDQQLPADQRQASFSITVPVRHQGELRGWILMGIRGQDFAGGVLSRSAQGLVGSRLTARDDEGRPVVVADVAPSYSDPLDVRAVGTVEVAQRSWTITTAASAHRMVPLMQFAPWPMVAACLLVTLLLGLLVHVLSSGRSRAEVRAREADDQLRGVTTRLEDLIWSAEARPDGAMPLIFVNTTDPTAMGMGTVRLGLDLVEHLRARTVEEDRPQLEQFLATLAVGDPAEVEIRVRSEDDRVRWVWTRAFPRRDGARLYVDGITSDVHRRKVLDQQRNQFLAIAGHEMRTPLTIIRGYAEYLIAEDADPLARRHGLEAISRRSRQMELLLSDFFDLSRLESGVVGMERRRVDLDAVVRVAGEDFAAQAREAGVALELEVAPAQVDADPVRMRQVVDNLVDNALKYSRRDGTVRVSVGADPADPAWVRLVVTDDGIGVPPDEVGLIFDRFFRGSNAEGHVANGTGLGLAVVSTIVQAPGGRNDAASPPGEGLTVTVVLPAAVGPGPDEPAGADEPLDERDVDEGAMLGA